MTSGPSLPAELTIYTVGDVRPLCLKWLSEAREATVSPSNDVLTLDASGVVEIDAAGVQLLLSLSHALRREHRVLQLSKPPQVLVDACRALGAKVLLCESESSGAAA